MEHAGTNQYRTGRHPDARRIYLLTARTYEGQSLLGNARCANIVLGALAWLNQAERIDLLAAVVLPDHVQFVARLNLGSVDTLVHSFKSYTEWQIRHVLNRDERVWRSDHHERALEVGERPQTLIELCLGMPARAGFVEDIRDYPWWYCCYESAP